MINFIPDQIDEFLGTVRKYMAIRGGLSQKDLAENVQVGVSTMSRFLGKKTKDYDEQLIAKIVAHLNIPLHEIIEFIAEESTQQFKKLVQFYVGDQQADKGDNDETIEDDGGVHNYDEEAFADGLDPETTRAKTTAKVRIGNKTTNIPFGGEEQRQDTSLRNKLQSLSPRQKGFLTDFLDLDLEGRDLIVDVGNQLFRYFKQSSADF